MFLVGLITWWYGQGWQGQLAHVLGRVKATAAFFSVGQLAVTLFAPFRQISASGVSGPVAIQLRAFFDKLVSRIIGAIVRTFTIIIGSVVIVLQLLIGFVTAVLWLLVPILPIAGLLLFAIGWVPWT